MVLKKKTFYIKFFALLFAVVAVCFVVFQIPFQRINDFCSSTFLTQSELAQIETTDYFGPFLKLRVKNDELIKASSTQLETFDFEPEIEFRLFNLIPIKNQRVKILKTDSVLAGGCAIGLVLKTNGVLVVGSSPVSTVRGEKDVLDDNILQVGDVITQIENETVSDGQSISKIVNEEKNRNKELEVKLVRKNKEVVTRVKPCYDIKSENYKLGVWVRDDASGIGTLTFVNKNNRFGALGHPICDSDTRTKINLKDGKVYNCSVLGVNKGSAGYPGEIKGLFMQGKNEQGVIEKNNDYGVFGSLNEDSTILSSLKEMEVGSRLSVKPGKAQICCCINGTNIETFDIEIIKTNYQNYSNDKSMVIRVTDEDLIKRTGGIVQGMSGSPIIQNGKIVGAVTHVFVSDSTKGFGVYIDWMLNQ
jgi:stage IV sporulation protein B